MTAIAGTVSSFKSMADGCIRIAVDFREAESKQAMTLLCDVGASVGIARLIDEQHQSPDVKQAEQDQSVDAKAPYGVQANFLRKSGFFRIPLVWQAIGSDAQFLEWLRQQKCAACNAPGPSEAAHVRRIANGAGTGIKPEFSSIPLCSKDHRDQHQYGESRLFDKAGWDRLRIRYVEQWGWESIKKILGVVHMNELEPSKLQAWAFEKGLSHYLPSGYL